MQDAEKFIEPWVTEEGWQADDFANVATPVYVVSEEKLESNLDILNEVEQDTGVKVLAALKGFSMFSTFDIANKYLSGSEASSVFEARLGHEEFGKETHVFCPSYTDENIHEYLKYADHLVFNSFSQWKKFKDIALDKGASCGMRVNLEHREADVEMYDPSKPNSHFGVTRDNFEPNSIEGLEGLHFHNLCESSAEAFVRSLAVFESKFGEFLPNMKWVNFGGGHHITCDDYNLELLKDTLNDFKKRYPHLTVYLEPGEAVALNAGVLVGSVLDIVPGGSGMDTRPNDQSYLVGQVAVLDVSPTCHMPDVLEIPYSPHIIGAKQAKDGDQNIFRLVGPTCLTGDVIGDYAFPTKLEVGQKVVFLNMAIYTMVKNNTFNGVNLPSIAIMNKDKEIKVVREFDYKDFKERLS